MNTGVNKEMEFSIVLNEPKCVKELIQKTEDGMYPTVSNDGEKVLVFIEKNKGMDVHFYQHNGWIRVDSYDNDGQSIGETFAGRWNK